MRSTLMKVDEIRLRLFLLKESRRTSLSLDRPYAAERVSSCAPIAEGNHLASPSPLENTWRADSARSTAEGNLLLFPNQQTRKMVVERANETTDKERVRLCLQLKQKSCGTASSFKQGLHEIALDCSAYLAEKLTDQPVLKVDEYFKELIPEAELGRSKKHVFSTKKEARVLM